MIYPKQYEIYEFALSNLDKNPSNKILAVILSPDEMNEVLKTVIIAPLCTKCNPMPTTIKIDKEMMVKLEQISTISKKRIIKKFGKIEQAQIGKIKQVLKEILIY